MPEQEELNKGFKIGEWEVLPSKGVLRSAAGEEHPEPKVFEVLMALARRDGDLVSHDEFIVEVWDGRPTADEPIIRCIAQLRKHLGDRERPYRYIETKTRRGYRLCQKIQLKEPADAPPRPPEPAVSRWRSWVIAATGVAIAVTGFLMWPPSPLDPDDVSSVAVLPFENLSGDPGDQYLVSGFKEELVQTLHGIPDVLVKHGRITYPDLEVTEIAQLLGVDAVLLGSVRRDDDALKISYLIAEKNRGVTISSGTFTGRVDELFGLQERLAVLVRDDLLGESPQQLMSRSRPESTEGYDRYMRGVYAIERRTMSTNLEEAIELLKETIRLDPQFGPAYLSLATAYAVLPDYRDAPLDKMHRLAIDTVERGIAVDDSIRDAASAVFGFVYHKQRNWGAAEKAYIRAINAAVVDSNAFNWYARMLAGVGRREDALRQALTAQKLDPSNAVINSLVAVIYTWLNDAERAEEYYERSEQLGANGTNHLLGRALLLIRQGRYAEARELARAGASVNGGGASWVNSVFAAMADPAKRADALATVGEASASGQLDPRIELVLRTVLDDLDGALKVAESLAEPGKYFEIDVLFLPELRPLREHPGFFDVIDKLGIQQYWDENGCVWLDDSVSCPG